MDAVSIARARVSVTGTFFLHGAVFSSWYARLPAIQERLDLTPGQLGIALFGAPAGLLVAQPAIGALAARTGSRPIVAAAPLYLGAVVLPALAVDTVTLLVTLVLVGAASGVLDIAMNAQGLAVERASGGHLFNSLHAAFSFGALAGAGVAAAAAGVTALPFLMASALVGAVGVAALAPGLLHDRNGIGAPLFAKPSRRLAALGVIAFCALLAEGAVFDWSGIYLVTQMGTTAGIAPLGLAGFSLFMGLGRLAGDAAAARTGSTATARSGALIAALGLGVALAAATPIAAVTGFALMGLGLSVVFPLTLRASTLGSHTASAPSVAAVSTVGYGGLLIGPPVIGVLADATDLRAALTLACLLCAVAAALATHIGRGTRAD
ncbi:MAG: MFS transporter [Pseudonocardiaceae bacterium]